MRMGRLGLVVTLAALVGLACSGRGNEAVQPTPTLAPAAEESPTPAPSGTSTDEGESPVGLELIKGPLSEDGLQAIFATPDLGTGKHRVAFALTSRTGLIDAPTATVQSFYNPDPEAELSGEPVQTPRVGHISDPSRWWSVDCTLHTSTLTKQAPGPSGPPCSEKTERPCGPV